jgi:hypothetical protein
MYTYVLRTLKAIYIIPVYMYFRALKAFRGFRESLSNLLRTEKASLISSFEKASLISSGSEERPSRKPF